MDWLNTLSKTTIIHDSMRVVEKYLSDSAGKGAFYTKDFQFIDDSYTINN